MRGSTSASRGRCQELLGPAEGRHPGGRRELDPLKLIFHLEMCFDVSRVKITMAEFKVGAKSSVKVLLFSFFLNIS